MKIGRILRVTEYCPITGNSLTSIYRKRCYLHPHNWKLIKRYSMEPRHPQTIGLREPHLGSPSVQKEYGDIDYTKSIYIFKLIL
jgi:hypothetical protein